LQYEPTTGSRQGIGFITSFFQMKLTVGVLTQTLHTQ
jgi:hypothetical protein